MSEDITTEVSEKTPVFVSIDGEAWREYEFPNNVTTRIYNPLKLNVKRSAKGDSHRLIDAQGVSHYIPSGWIHLKWAGKDKSNPEYQF